ncbi:type I restriction enzyme, R subunit [Chitinophaga costaii]|uniref:Type I restriction enzyme, R subunit n=1 Tax=Chitinophaga costaii TaxID=1335309 RepID=A0A1C4ATG9_9BACT|nr:hypothetical protein [Chitinophaga costaii]PUZ26740.1 hypothetical protein DCM91_10080 [Chitinophaga costaii]SCB97980.1 type I restriction enzyme, R subunit [Chitinophaga costaii]
MKKIELLKERTIQDYRSTYNDIRDWLRREKNGAASEESTIDWDDQALKWTYSNRKR